jgi:ABC-type multidrug transport system fused ATPase/permease subunit
MNQLLPHKLCSAFFAVIENQGISEIGTRQELLARGGVYASLERAQEIGG